MSLRELRWREVPECPGPFSSHVVLKRTDRSPSKLIDFGDGGWSLMTHRGARNTPSPQVCALIANGTLEVLL